MATATDDQQAVNTTQDVPEVYPWPSRCRCTAARESSWPSSAAPTVSGCIAPDILG